MAAGTAVDLSRLHAARLPGDVRTLELGRAAGDVPKLWQNAGEMDGNWHGKQTNDFLVNGTKMNYR